MRFLTLCCFFLFVSVHAQVIPLERITDWSDPGAKPAFVPDQSINILDHGADPTGVTSCNAALLLAIAELGGAGEVYFPPGDYLFPQYIGLPDSIILQGAADTNGQPLARLLLASGENADGVRIIGSESAVPAVVVGPLIQGDRHLVVDQPALFQPGDVIRLHATDDSTLVVSDWSIGQTGQVVEIIAIVADTLMLERPLRRTYTSAPLIRKLTPKRQVHLRCLFLERTEVTTSQTANVFFMNTLDCSMTGIRSVLCNYAHVNVFRSARVTIANCHFKEAHSYGSGGKAYGVLVDYSSGDSYVHQNTFEHLRHAMMVQAGANGNVFAYNRSIDPFWSSFPLPSNAAGDIVVHGNYPYLNLFEGNVVQNIVLDNSHGISGPYNTFFRNRSELYGIYMNTSPATNNQNFIGNQVTNTNSSYGFYALQGTGHFTYGNQIKGAIMPAGTDEPVATSLFEYPFPEFYSIHSSVPPVRTDNWQSATPLIEAQYRWEMLGRPSTCDDVDYETSTAMQDTQQLGEPVLFPNPTGGILHVQSASKGPVAYRIVDALGQCVQQGRLQHGAQSLSVTLLSPGAYALVFGETSIRFVRE